MLRLLEINTSFQRGGAGKVARGIAEAASKAGWQVLAAHSSRFSAPLPEGVQGYRIGSKSSEYLHFLSSWAAGRHGFGSAGATCRLIAQIQDFGPHLIHLHNLHGYYLNIKLLFDFLRQSGVPVVWTLHDLWPLTGRCASPQAAECEAYKRGCDGCPTLCTYPAAIADRSGLNFRQKSEIFAGVPRLHLATMSRWLADYPANSSLKDYPLHIIPNGVDIKTFSPTSDVPAEAKSVLAVAAKWTAEKGYDEMLRLRSVLPADYKITMVGVSAAQRRALARVGISGVEKTDSPEALARLYRQASVMVSLSHADNFPTVLLESLACGTPVVAYDTGACAEIVGPGCGFVVPKGDVKAAAKKVIEICTKGKATLSADCRERAVSRYDNAACHQAYLDLFQSLMP